jgi:hypothetical protein
MYYYEVHITFLCSVLSANCDAKILRFHYIDSLDRVVSIATGYGLDDQGVGVRVPIGSRNFSSPRRPGRLWGPPNLLSNGYRGLFPQGLSGRGVKLTAHLQLVPRPPAQADSSLADFSTLKMEAIRSSEKSVHTRSIRRHIPEDHILHSHRRENLKSYKQITN